MQMVRLGVLTLTYISTLTGTQVGPVPSGVRYAPISLGLSIKPAKSSTRGTASERYRLHTAEVPRRTLLPTRQHRVWSEAIFRRKPRHKKWTRHWLTGKSTPQIRPEKIATLPGSTSIDSTNENRCVYRNGGCKNCSRGTHTA